MAAAPESSGDRTNSAQRRPTVRAGGCRDELERLVRAADIAPDHERPEPWRLIPVAGAAAAKPQRAPLLPAIVHGPVISTRAR